MEFTIAIIGGSQEGTYKKVAEKVGCQIIFHQGKVRNGAVKKDFKNIVGKADCVVLLLGAVGHVTMDTIKRLCKESNTPLTFHKSFGASGAIQKGLNILKETAA